MPKRSRLIRRASVPLPTVDEVNNALVPPDADGLYLLLACILSADSYPSAACQGHADIFAPAATKHRETPEALAERRATANRICDGCMHSPVCNFAYRPIKD
ncbi:hypothetical protein ACOI93_01120 [Corynebacterium striatum]|uniref:hypothetical protein n=1 Tax=Corynebacterium striatum TaxID=43770 RepID=UPI003B5A1EBF